MRLKLEITRKEVKAFSKPVYFCWVYDDWICRTRSVGSKLEVSQLMPRKFYEDIGKLAYSNGKILVLLSKSELLVVDCKRDFSQFNMGPTPFKTSFSEAMTSLKNKVFFIIPSPSRPSRQFNLKEQEWRELPPLPELQSSIAACTVEVTEKLYVYQYTEEYYQNTVECNLLQELDLNTLRWRPIHLPISLILKYYPIYFPGGSSLILVNGDAEVIRIDPEQATVSKVGEVATRNFGFGFVHEGMLIQHIHYCN
eukprot:CAMPEP_0204917998 /NCGR_PEP_ID=MMETSP1397-20131031/15723_1 /ASSEMBLY_ACC=CAM_ASM_000891 /TAXON_ID=49980 /ORGANISM="Climacostomum Climacostomum virens, Strain Stock W-24" /LENGTH=252 /DNA_ID=CAMNT_0052091057 /DNA_START=1 /DNA_END=756 /DNA_ORIENTATION=+